MDINTRDLGFVNYNGQEMNFVNFNGVTIYEAWKKLLASGIPPLTLLKCKPSDLLNYKIFGNSVSQARLPQEYQEVEYIQTTGTQHIDSGVLLVSGLKMIVDWVYQDSDSGNNYTGGHIGSPGNRWLIGSQRKEYYCFAIGASNVSSEFKFGNRDVLEAYWGNKSSYLIVNDVKSTLIKWENYTFTDEPNYTFYMGATNRDGNPALKPKLTIYSWKFYQDDVLVRDFIPCYRKSDGEIGMYDLVTKTFYTNAGTGTFIKGNVIPTETESVGDYDEKTGKYKIPVKVNNSITNIYTKQPLRKNEDYIDYTDYKEQKIFRNIMNTTFDGTENWEIHTDISGGSVFRLDNVLNPLINAPLTSTYMSHFALTDIYSTAKFQVGTYRFSSNQDVDKITGTRLYISSPHTTVEEFKQWLSENKPMISYPIETSEENIDLPNIAIQKDTNVIEIDTTIIPSNLEVLYYGKK